jgi:hypothetical protein
MAAHGRGLYVLIHLSPAGREREAPMRLPTSCALSIATTLEVMGSLSVSGRQTGKNAIELSGDG